MEHKRRERLSRLKHNKIRDKARTKTGEVLPSTGVAKSTHPGYSSDAPGHFRPISIVEAIIELGSKHGCRYEIGRAINNLNTYIFENSKYLALEDFTFFTLHKPGSFLTRTPAILSKVNQSISPGNLSVEHKKILISTLLYKHKHLLAKAWATKGEDQKIDYILALHENTTENRASLDNIIYYLEEVGILHENELEFHYISPSQEFNIDSDKVVPVSIAS